MSGVYSPGYAGPMLIEVLGLPDDRTAALEAALDEALARRGLCDAPVQRIEDTGAMIARGVRQPPALRLDGKVVCRGRVPDVTEILGYLDGAET
jgi:hypothetical protein